MTILVTGGTGKTPTCVARQLQTKQVPFIIASRKGAPSPPTRGLEQAHYIEFDYSDAKTFDNPFEHPSVKADKISAVFLLVPEIPDAAKHVNSFIDRAVSRHDVKKFVMLGTQTLQKGGDKRYTEKVWEHLDNIRADYTVLGPTMFMENFIAPGHESFEFLKKDDKIYTSVGKGQIAYVAVDDVAALAAARLTSNEPLKPGKELVLGPELMTVDDVGAVFSKVLGRPIQVVHLSGEDRSKHLRENGFPELYVHFIPRIEGIAAAGGLAEAFGPNVASFRDAVGRELQGFSAWAEQNVPGKL